MAYPPQLDLSDLPDKYDPKKHAVIDLSDLPDQKDKILEEAKKPLDESDDTTKLDEGYKPRNILLEGRQSLVEQQKEQEHEPGTWMGGFLKSLKDQILGTTIPALQGAAHPETAGDIASLLLPSELPNLRKYLPGASQAEAKLPEIAQAVKEPVNPALDNITRNAPYGEGSIMPSTTLPSELRGEMIPQEDFPPVNFREDKMPPPSPDLTPVGQEEDYNSMFGMSGRKPLKDLQYELAQNKFGMGKELPSAESPVSLDDLPHPTEESVPHDVEPTAKFLALGEDGKPLYNIEGGLRDKSTVTADTLQQMGIETPPTPEGAKPMKGSELRELALKARQSTANDAPLSAPGNGGTPQFNPRGQSGLTGQLQQIGKDIVDPATGEVVPPKVDLGGTEPPINNGGSGSNGGGPKEPVNPDLTPEGKKPSTLSEILNTPRALQIGNLHLSAPLRQGLPLITTKSWWTSWNAMFKAYGSQMASDAIDAQIHSHPLFKRGVSPTGKELPSYADRVGLSLTNDLTKREEILGSKWLEKVPGYKASNRAFKTYLNKLRSDTLISMVDDATKSSIMDKVPGFRRQITEDSNPLTNIELGRNIADFINNATGRGSLRGKVPFTNQEINLEKSAELLNNTLFAPRKIAGNIAMLNPANYITGNPYVRRQYLKAMLSTVGAWTTFAGLAKAAGAEVSLDPNNADFGKIKIGNTRLDPAGGFQQYLVAGARLLSNSYTSSTTGKSSELGGKFGSSTRKDIVENFASNKLNTPFKFAYDLLNASKGRPYNISDQAARMFIPIVAQDIIELAKEDPRLLPTAIPAMFGMGEQTYGRKGAKQTVIPKALSVNIH